MPKTERVIGYADGSRIAYVVKIGKLYWSRDRSRRKAKKPSSVVGVRATRYKDFHSAGIITSLAIANRVATEHKGKVMSVRISLDA